MSFSLRVVSRDLGFLTLFLSELKAHYSFNSRPHYRDLGKMGDIAAKLRYLTTSHMPFWRLAAFLSKYGGSKMIKSGLPFEVIGQNSC
jgi:hypothetical protein